MKKSFTFLCIFFALTMLPQASKAGTYYVLNGEPFTLSAATGSLSYIWTIKTGLIESIQTLPTSSMGALTHTFSDAASSPTFHTISLGVIQALEGCLSEVVQDTIIVLPKVTITLNADKLNFCTDKAVDATLTASLNVTGLTTYGITTLFEWKKEGGSVITGETGSTLRVTAAGVYEATLSYVLPTEGIYKPTASKLLNYVTLGSKEILHSLPVPTKPLISFN